MMIPVPPNLRTRSMFSIVHRNGEWWHSTKLAKGERYYNNMSTSAYINNCNAWLIRRMSKWHHYSTAIMVAGRRKNQQSHTPSWKYWHYTTYTFNSEAEFHRIADETLENIENAVEEVAEDDVEIQCSSGVLTLRLGDHGTWVINKQSPNQQLWWSSPISGPKRYEYVGNGIWAYTRRIDNDPNQLQPTKTLFHILNKEFQDIYGIELPLDDK
jgi:frataxin